MAKRFNSSFILLWLACGGLAILAGGAGRVSKGKPFFARYDTPLENIFYAVGVMIFGLAVGWLVAKLVQRMIKKRDR